MNLKKILIFISLIAPSLFGQVALAGSVPQCWSADQGQAILDGVFVFQIPTTGTSASEVAQAISLLTNSMAAQVGISASSDLSSINIAVEASVDDYRSSLSFPTLNSFKAAIVDSLQSAANLPGVTTFCAPLGYPIGPRPGGSVSN